MEDNRMVLRTEDLVKKYGKRTVVSHVSIDVKQGEIVGLLGPNGAGKTTSFYMTVGLITPNEGRIFLDDLEITNYPVYKRAQTGIGYLAQEASVFRQMTVEDNIASVLEMTNKPKEYQKEKLESLIAEFRLQKVRKNLGNQLSGGERRRTEIARCLAIDPKFIMLDEPFAGVDPIAVEDIQQIVWKLKDKNIGILITDHNVQETLSITDRAYLLFEGKILFQGTPEELAENKIVREKYLSNSFVLRRKDFQLKENFRAIGEENCKTSGGSITFTEDADVALKDADFIYTDVWYGLYEAELSEDDLDFFLIKIYNFDTEGDGRVNVEKFEEVKVMISIDTGNKMMENGFVVKVMGNKMNPYFFENDRLAFLRVSFENWTKYDSKIILIKMKFDFSPKFAQQFTNCA